MPNAERCRARAIETLNGKRISYDDSDCQDAVEQIVQDCGGKMEFAGSNAMWRYAVIAVLPVAKAAKLNLQGGELTFRHADGYNSKYNDEKGDADHVGMFIGKNAFFDAGWSNGKGGWCDVFHSSMSRGQVCGSNLTKNDWTHVALAACIEYTQAIYSAFGVTRKTVHSDNRKPVNMRKAPDASANNRICGVPSGASVLVGDTDGDWARVAYGNQCGWMQAGYLSDGQNKTTGVIVMANSALYDAKVVTTGGILNIRSSAENLGKKNDIGDIPNGSLLQVLEEVDDTWARVYYNGQEGFVNREFISQVGDPSEAVSDDGDEAVSTAKQYGVFLPCASLEAANALRNIMRGGIVRHV